MFGLFKRKPVLDAVASQWLLDAYAWALREFDGDVFRRETILVTPTNEHFPGRVNSVAGMAQVIFDRVRSYAGLEHWSYQLVDGTYYQPGESPRLLPHGVLRGGNVPTTGERPPEVVIPYNPQQVNNPEALIASYAYVLAYYLGTQAKEPPPGGATYWPHATELLGIFLGFGLMFANTAYTFRGGCGSCYNPLAQRSAFLSQDEVTYALALFCALKKLDNKQVLPHLKKYLHPIYKSARAEIDMQQDRLSALRMEPEARLESRSPS